MKKNISGGKYTGEMKVNECTHLIINKPKGGCVISIVKSLLGDTEQALETEEKILEVCMYSILWKLSKLSVCKCS